MIQHFYIVFNEKETRQYLRMVSLFLNRSNFIQPADLMEFAQRLRIHHPPHRLTLDLRKNPGDRDPEAWNMALKRLQSICFLLVEGWKSTDTMVDHISNM